MKEKQPKNKIIKIILGIAIIVLLATTVILAFMNKSQENKDEKKLGYDELLVQIKEQKIEEIEMTVGSTTLKVKQRDVEEEKTTIIPNTQAFVEYVQEEIASGNNSFKLNQKQPNVILKIADVLFSLLPTIMIVALFIVILKMQGLGDKGKIYGEEGNNTNIKFDDVAGLEEEKTEMIEIVEFLKNPKKFNEMGAKIPRGILLCGKPRNWKNFNSKSNSRRSRSSIYINEWL